jgi:hypothetical protein
MPPDPLAYLPGAPERLPVFVAAASPAFTKYGTRGARNVVSPTAKAAVSMSSIRSSEA